MNNNKSNEYTGSSNSCSKPYERKVKLNQITPRKYFTELNNNSEEDVKEISKIINEQVQNKNEYRYNEEDNSKRYNFTDDIKKNITDNSDNLQNNYEYNSQDKTSRIGENGQSSNYQNQNFSDINNNENDNFSSQNQNDYRYVKKNYQFKYLEEEDNNEKDDKELPKYSYKYKHKIFEKEERNTEQNEQLKELKGNKEKIDLEELKKKPGRILHQSVTETYDDEGNKVVTTKTIKEFSQTTKNFRFQNVHLSKEKRTYERHTADNFKKRNLKYKERNNNFNYKNKLKKNGDNIYVLAHLSKNNNDSERKNKIYSTSISPIIIHESHGYDNVNSLWSNEIIDPNSFDRESYERSHYNYNYPRNYRRINVEKEQDNDDKYYYPKTIGRYNNINKMNEEKRIINYETYNKREDIVSPIGYIATYSSGSEDNAEIGRSYDHCRNRIHFNNYLINHSKGKNIKSRSIPNNSKDGELIKKTEITYQLDYSKDYDNNKKILNLSGLQIKGNIDSSKSDKRDFQSPDREYGVGSDKFRKVTMGMINSYGPTCEDRKISRKMRNEIGGVVDLRHEINPVNIYKIKKFKRFGANLINQKTKIESAKIIQYWWRKMKEKQIIRIQILKIIKLQSFIRGFLIRNQFIKCANICTFLEILKKILYEHYREEILKFLRSIGVNKLQDKLKRIINKIEAKNINHKLIKYFFKYRLISKLLGKQLNYFEETKEIKITEEMYVNYIKEKYIKANKSQHINELSINEKEVKKETNDRGIGSFSIKEGIEKNELNYIQNKKEYQEFEAQPVKQKIEMSKNEDFNIIDKKPELKIDKKEEYKILKPKIEFKDEETQQKIDLKEQGINPIKIENKVVKNEFINFIHKKNTEEKETIPNKYKKTSPKSICKNEKISYINNIIKIEKGQQMEPIKNIIKKNESINIISKVKKKKYYNAIKRSESFNIMKIKKKYQDKEVQYIPGKNTIQNQTIEIKRDKPKTKDDYSQYIQTKPTICKSNSYSILIKPKKKVKYNIRKNNFCIIKSQKIMKEKGEQCEIGLKEKSKEILIGNFKNRNKIIKIYEILEKIWLKKQIKKLINNCKSKIKEEAIKREIMRMTLLKWRFIKGYGADKYGIIYDRNGKKIREEEGKIKDTSIQNTLDDEINKTLLRNKQLQIKVSKQKPVYIKSNIIKKKMKDSGTGDGINNTLNERIDKILSFGYKRKSKGVNKISNKNYFKISKAEKIYKNQGTSMIPAFNKIVNEKRIFINNDRLKNKKYRIKDLLLQIVSKCIIREKYKLNDYFSNWHKKTVKIIEEERLRELSINKSKIIKNEKFEIINKKEKRDKSCGNVYIPNKIARASKIEFRQRKLKKDEGILISFPNMFKKENLKRTMINNDIYRSKKPPTILRKVQSVNTSILGSSKNILSKEIIEETIKRKKYILTKYIKMKSTSKSILRKYFTMWNRKSQYIALLDNAEIISVFCKSKLNGIKAKQNWNKLYQKMIIKTRQNNIIKILKTIKSRRNKLLQLIRITSLIRFHNQKVFLHKIITYWLIYCISATKKRSKLKILYENMLTTYMSMADDIFGKNQKNNPSIQDFMFEIVDTDKYQVKELEDVPIAKTYYSKKKEEKKVVTNIKYENIKTKERTSNTE